jgi:virginiamycin B lyase
MDVTRTLAALASIAILLGLGEFGATARAADAVLSGQVSSAAEGAMEGVLVTAKRDGATIRISVVSDAQGRYGFPADRLVPGHYTLTIRAAGYDLDAPRSADIAAGQAVTADLKLKPTGNLAAQLTNADWMSSVPDTPQRRGLAGCTNCHTVQRILDSTHDADEFMALIPRMMRYGAMSKPNHPQVAADRQPTSEPKGDVLRKLAEYYASINRSQGPRSFALKTAPRPTGRGTHVIMTEYELPRPDLTEPHDVVVDGEGTVWYSNFGEQILGQLDPKTGEVTEHPLPLFKPGAPTGSLNLELDRDGNPWVAMMYQAAVAKLDKKTGEVRAYPLPAELDNPRVQIGMLDPHHSDVDGKVWVDEGGTKTLYRLDPVSGKFEHLDPFKDLPNSTRHATYGIAADAQNNLWFMDFADRNIGETDKTGKTLIYPVPTPASRPRRGHMTTDGRLAFAEFVGDKIGIFDTRTEQVREWPVPTSFAPYDAVLDKNEELWTGGMNADRILRLDTETGQSVSYLLPEQTNIRRVFVDNSTTPVTFWVGNNHDGSIVKLEPLD